jgi:hypothetical protein
MSTQLPTFQDQNGRDWTLPELVRTALYDYGHVHGYLKAEALAQDLMDQVDDIIDTVKADELREQAQERDHERHLEQLRQE